MPTHSRKGNESGVPEFIASHGRSVASRVAPAPGVHDGLTRGWAEASQAQHGSCL